MSEQRRSPVGPTHTRTAGRVCLAAVIAGPLLTPAFMRQDPQLFGWPFFYWYQFLWVPLGAILLTCAYVIRQRAERPEVPTGDER
ncbi:DUF3311 domain-containing protein [Streptomyces boninensis]|uniref:DUF3311 domain-containing protein n=1 Tax=Streptomyces boninensis TaxID=2039455 RepID=UPI003B2233CB